MDFDGYLLFDNLAPGPSDKDIFVALELNSAEVVHKRCFFYREHFRKKRCAVVKYISIEVANNALRSHNQKIVFGFKVYVLEIKRNLSELAKTEGSVLECFPELETIIGTEVLILNIGLSINSSGDCFSRMLDVLTRFGPITSINILGKGNKTFVNFLIHCQNYSSALAAHIACSNTVINGRTVTVAVHRRKFETIKKIMSMKYDSYEGVLQRPPSVRTAIPTDWLEMEDGVPADEGAAEKLEQRRQAPEHGIGVASAPQQDVGMDEEIWCINSDASLAEEVRQMNALGALPEFTRNIYAAVEELNISLGTLLQREHAATILSCREHVAAGYGDQGHTGFAAAEYEYNRLLRPEVAVFQAYNEPAKRNLEIFLKRLNDYFASFSGDNSFHQTKLEASQSKQPESVSQESEDVAKQPEAAESKQPESVSQESEDVAKQPEADESKQTENVSRV